MIQYKLLILKMIGVSIFVCSKMLPTRKNVVSNIIFSFVSKANFKGEFGTKYSRMDQVTFVEDSL